MTRHLSLPRRRRAMGTRAGLIVVFMLAWQALPQLGIADGLTVVPFTEAVSQAVKLLTSGEILADLWTTVSMILLSFALSAVLGLAAGLLLWRYSLPYRLLNPYLTTYYALPIFVFYPALIAVFGLTVVPVILIAAMWAVVAVVVNTVTGLNAVPRVYHKVVRAYRLTPLQAFRRVYLGAAAPMIINGLKLAASYCIIGVVAAEFILAPEDGLGYRVSYYYNNFGLANMYATVLIIIVLATGLNALVGRLEGLLRGGR